MIEDIIRAVLGKSPGTKRINTDLAIMRQQSQAVIQELIPWEEEKELELLSLNAKFKAEKKGLDKMIFGTVQSIYYEPMIAFAYKDYVKGHRDGLLFCRTKGLEFVYRLKRQETDVYFNAKPVAVMNLHGVMHGLKSQSPLGYVAPYSQDLLSLFVQGKDVGHMFNPSRPHSEQQRAFYVLAKLEEEQEYIMLALGIYELVSRLLANKKVK